MPHELSGIRRFVSTHLWAMLPEYMEAMLDVLSLRADGIRFTNEEIDARIAAADHGALGLGASAPKPAAVSTVAILPLYGMLSPKGGATARVSGPPGTSTQAFGRAFDAAIADPNISAVVIDVDSPGGVVTGTHELASTIRAARGSKRVVSYVSGMAASAAYWVASAADEIAVTPSGDVGSIGIYTVHEDLSGALSQRGIKQTVIKAGKYKAEGHPSEPLSDEALAATQERVDEMYAMFTGDVAKNMGVPVSDVRGGFGEGRVVGAKKAVQLGMAHRVASMDEVLRDLARGKPAPSGRRADLARAELDLLTAKGSV